MSDETLLKNRAQHFLNRASKIHGDLFDYSRVSYQTAKVKIEIICRKHGPFYQTPDKHLSLSKYPCPKCWQESRSKVRKNAVIKAKLNGTFKKKESNSADWFLNKAKLKFGDKFLYDLNDYKGIVKSPINITCPIHGGFSQIPNTHLCSNTGCYNCGREKAQNTMTTSYEEAIQDCHKIHNNLYEYPAYNKEKYINRCSKIDIICKEHGLFSKKTQKHLSGQGCYKCMINRLIKTNLLVGGYSENLFAEKPELKKEPATLYYLKINNGQYYKIGISRRKLSNRIKSILSKSKLELTNCEIISNTQETLYSAFVKEQKILKDNDNVRLFTSWSSEVFSCDIWDNIKNYF